MEIIEKVINGVTVKEVIVGDLPFASIELKQERLSICNSCEFLRVDGSQSEPMQKSCSQCSCLLVNRISYQDSFCPEGKW